MLSCHTNEYYGHAEVFRLYADLPVYYLVNGRLQHGWSAANAGIIAGDVLHKHGGNFFVWTEKDSKYGRNDRYDLIDLPKDKTFVVGSPIIYADLPEPTHKRSLLAISKHSLRKMITTEDSWRRYLEFVRSYDTEACVLLHHRDVDIGRARLVEDYGLSWSSAGKTTSLDFFANLIHLLSLYDQVIATNVQTALFYALYLGKYVKVCGPKISTDPPDFCERFVLDTKWEQENYPWLLDGTKDKKLAYKEIGLEHKKTKEEIRRIMFNA